MGVLVHAGERMSGPDGIPYHIW